MFEPDDLLVALTGAGVEFVVIGGVAVRSGPGLPGVGAGTSHREVSWN